MPINATRLKCCLTDTWFCEDTESWPDGRDEGVGGLRKSSSSSSSMSQASLVLRANSWKLDAFLDLRLLNLGFVSLGYLQMDTSRGLNRQNGERDREKLKTAVVSYMAALVD